MILIQSKIFRSTKGTDFSKFKNDCFQNKAKFLFSRSAISPMELEVHSSDPKA